MFALYVIFRNFRESVSIMILTNPYFYSCDDREIIISQVHYPSAAN